MFPDSKIAKAFGCARTKTTQILNGAMMSELKGYIISQMKEGPFSLVNDGTSDTGVKKMNAACALIFDINKTNEVIIETIRFCLKFIFLYFSCIISFTQYLVFI